MDLKGSLRTIRQRPLLCAFFLALGILAGIAVMQWRAPVQTPAQSAYRGLSNQELTSRALETARGVRELARSFNAADDQIMRQCGVRAAQAVSDEAGNQSRQACADELNRSTQMFIGQYQDKHRAEVLLTRAELLRRLPEDREKALTPVLANQPTNSLGLAEVATGLELLAKRLPAETSGR